MMKKLHNPIIGDSLEILTEGKDTGQAWHLIQAFIPKGSPGPPPHYHLSFSEEFTVLEGRLYLLNGNKKMVLTKGQTFLAEKGKIHTFWTEESDARFLCEVTPACEGQYLALLIASNLAKAGLTNKKGIPAKLWHLAVLLDMGDSRPTGFFATIGGILGRMAKTAKGKRVKAELLEKYGVWADDAVNA
ncbi:MAG: cupin domain-containing protein [Leadbetterella sp.]|nr:cupin domain-containing protein [Leadbetterella sp.]